MIDSDDLDRVMIEMMMIVVGRNEKGDEDSDEMIMIYEKS